MAEREARRYEHPIPSREAVMACLEQHDNPLSYDDLTAELGISSRQDHEHFSKRLRAMQRDGQLLQNRLGLYGLVSRLDMICGTLTGHPDGFGFLIPDDGSEDLFMSPREMRKALHGDRVMGHVTGTDRRGRKTGAVVEVLEHRHQQVVGRYIEESGTGFVVPEDKRINQDFLVPADKRAEAGDGQMVIAQITVQPSVRKQPVVEIIEVLGDHMAPGMEVEVAIRKYELPHQWPDTVEEEARVFGESVEDKAKKGRLDLRDLPLVTIDGEDARDFDDAVYAENNGKGWRLIVAIADVSHYVKPDAPLDQEAYKRGTSVYFPNRVIPMLPEALSNGLCSLNPKVDRLCMVCDMHINTEGHIKGYSFHEAVMRSHERLTYTEVAAMLVDRDARLCKQYQHVLPHLEDLYSLYRALNNVRKRRGSVDFDLPETRIIYDDNGKIDRVVATERNDAHRLIEECMLAANVCAAKFLEKNEIPAPYRVHAGPTDEKLGELREFLFELGLSIGGGDDPQAEHYAQVLEAIKGRPEYRLVQTVLLRSLSQAIYSPDNIGHFALAYPQYAHFTSPIRRYPDLMVHRAIRGRLQNQKRSLFEPYNAVKTHAEHCSMTGRRADEANWDVIKWLKTEYMMDKVGEQFEGVISGVANFGIFVELKEIFVEGLVHITSLGNDYYHFDPTGHRLEGERTHETFRLGDHVKVKVSKADLDEARIDFELIEHEATQGPVKKKRDNQKGSRKNRKAGHDKKGSRGKKKQAKKKAKKKTDSKAKKKTRSGRRGRR